MYGNRISSQISEKRSGRLIIAILLGLMFLVYPEEALGLNDNEITSAVFDLLEGDKFVNSNMIDVRTNTGIVTLTGQVDNILARERAVELAKMVKGVRSVIDLIKLKLVNRSDKLLLNDLKLAFGGNDDADRFKINANVRDGIVTLTGSVESWQEKSICIQIAKRIKDIREVRGNIDVRPIKNRLDVEIEAEIRRLLSWDVYVDDARINVKVDDGRVALNGSVSSIGEKTRAFRNAWVEGVISVDDENLRVITSKKSAMVNNFDYILKSRGEIKKAIEDTLANDPRIISDNLQIDVDRIGTVTLHGFVRHRDEKMAAEQDAKNTLGVFMVNSNLKIQPSVSADLTKIQNSADAEHRSAANES